MIYDPYSKSPLWELLRIGELFWEGCQRVSFQKKPRWWLKVVLYVEIYIVQENWSWITWKNNKFRITSLDSWPIDQLLLYFLTPFFMIVVRFFYARDYSFSSLLGRNITEAGTYSVILLPLSSFTVQAIKTPVVILVFCNSFIQVLVGYIRIKKVN